MNLQSTAGTLNIKDFLKGLLMAVGTAVLVVLQNSIAAGTLTFNWKAIGIAASAAGIMYLIKNFATNDVAVAEKTLDVAQQKAIDKQNL